MTNKSTHDIKENNFNYQKNIKDQNDDEQQFIDKTETQEELQDQSEAKTETVQKSSEVQNIVSKLKGFVFPKNNQQRNLSRETGGLEAEEDKGISEQDVWDERTDEVQKMGSKSVFNSTGMRSVINKMKKNRKEEKERIEAAMDAAAAAKGSRNNKGFAAKVENQNNNRGGGASR